VKRLILLLIAAAFIPAMALGAGGLESSTVPADVCKAIEQYVARVNTIGALSDKAERQGYYSKALSDLEPVIRRYKMDPLLPMAKEFAEATELVTVTDPVDGKFGELTDKRLKSRAALQNLCMPYTTAR
jgi:hypothetical protein